MAADRLARPYGQAAAGKTDGKPSARTAAPGSVATLKNVFPLLHTANPKGTLLGSMAPADWANTRTRLQQHLQVGVLPASNDDTNSLIAQ